jgi:hypothetical protein
VHTRKIPSTRLEKRILVCPTLRLPGACRRLLVGRLQATLEISEGGGLGKAIRCRANSCMCERNRYPGPLVRSSRPHAPPPSQAILRPWAGDSIRVMQGQAGMLIYFYEKERRSLRTLPPLFRLFGPIEHEASGARFF